MGTLILLLKCDFVTLAAVSSSSHLPLSVFLHLRDSSQCHKITFQQQYQCTSLYIINTYLFMSEHQRPLAVKRKGTFSDNFKHSSRADLGIKLGRHAQSSSRQIVVISTTVPLLLPLLLPLLFSSPTQ